MPFQEDKKLGGKSNIGMSSNDIARICVVGLDGSCKTALCNALSSSASSSSSSSSSEHKSLASAAHLICCRRNVPPAGPSHSAVVSAGALKPFREHSVSRSQLEVKLAVRPATPRPTREQVETVKVEPFTPAAKNSDEHQHQHQRMTSQEDQLIRNDESAKPSAVAANDDSKLDSRSDQSNDSPGLFSGALHPNAVRSEGSDGDDEDDIPAASSTRQQVGSITPPASDTPVKNPLSGSSTAVASSPVFSPPGRSRRQQQQQHGSFILRDLSGSALLRGAWVPSILTGAAAASCTADADAAATYVPCDGIIFCISATDILRVSFAWTECMQLARTVAAARGRTRVKFLVVFVNKSSEYGKTAACPCITAQEFQRHLLPRFAELPAASATGGAGGGGGCSFDFADVTLGDVSQLAEWLLESF